jgi:hypothetical protein
MPGLLVKWMRQCPGWRCGTKICAIVIEKTSPSPSCVNLVGSASAGWLFLVFWFDGLPSCDFAL